MTDEFLDFNKVFSYEHLYVSARKCFKGVMWKASSQNYRDNLLLNVWNTYEELKNGTWKSRGFYEFDINERGKERHIQSVHISERVVQRCLCDFSLTPLIRPTLIYDNGACLKGKGIDFTISRLKEHLRRYYLTQGSKGYCLRFDFSKYFDNIDHDILKLQLKKIYGDGKLRDLLFELIDNFGDKGLGLGSQISQTLALMYPNMIDRYFKERRYATFYARYMDDGYIISENKEFLKDCLKDLKQFCDKLHITLNAKKTQIVKLNKGIPFLKRRFLLTKSGKILELPQKKTFSKMRRKGRKLNADARLKSVTSWKGHLLRTNCYYAVHRTEKLITGGQP